MHRAEEEHTSDNERGEENPAQFPPYTRLVSNHFLDVIIKLVHTITPGDGDTLKKHQEEQAHPTG